MTIILLDGYSLLHRVYHALPKFTDKEGNPTGALYGFCAVVLKVVREYNPDVLCAAFDTPETTFREELLAQYHANRPETESDFKQQVEPVKEFLRALDIPVLVSPGFEGDDVIGTLVAHFKTTHPRDADIRIVTSDRDALQLVDDRVQVYLMKRGMSDIETLDEQGVREKMGLAPDQIPDFKALAGDASDNFPGVHGIGPVGAKKLLAQFGHMEDIYRHLERVGPNGIPEALAEKLIAGKEQAFMSKKLAVIRTDAPLEIDKKRMAHKPHMTPEAEVFLERRGFKSLVKRSRENAQQTLL